MKSDRGAVSGCRLCLAALVCCLMAVACGTVDPDSSDLSSEAVSPEADSTSLATDPEVAESSTSSVPVEKPLLVIPDEWDDEWSEIEGRYLLYTKAFLVAASPPAADPDYPQLAELMTPAVFEGLVERLQAMADEPVVLVVPDDRPTEHIVWLPNPSVLSKEEGNEVIIQDCYINGLLAQDLDGNVLRDVPKVDLRNIKMKVVDGEWRLAAIRSADPGSGGQKECLDAALARSLPDSYTLPDLG